MYFTGTTASRRRKTKMEATLDVFAKKMGDVLEKDNDFLLQMQAAQHKHEMHMMSILTQMVNQPQPPTHQYSHQPQLQTSHYSQIPPSHSPFPPGTSQQSQQPPQSFFMPAYQQPSTCMSHSQPSFLRELEDPCYPPPFYPAQGQSPARQ